MPSQRGSGLFRTLLAMILLVSWGSSPARSQQAARNSFRRDSRTPSQGRPGCALRGSSAGRRHRSRAPLCSREGLACVLDQCRRFRRAPSIQWKLPVGITAGPMQFPAPHRLPLGPLMDYGYENEVLFPLTIHAAASVKVPSKVVLAAHVSWLVCREVCIPGKGDLALPLTVTRQPGAPRAASQAFFAAWRARLPQTLPPSARAVFAPAPNGIYDCHLGMPGTAAEFFPLDQSQIDNPAPQVVRAIQNAWRFHSGKTKIWRRRPRRLNGVLRLGDTPTRFALFRVLSP